MKRFSILCVIVTILTSGCATAKPAMQSAPPIRGSDCVFFRTLYDWQVLDDHNMIIWAPSRREAYQVYFMTPLVGLGFNVKLAFVDKDHDGRLCGFSRDEIVVPDPGFPQRANITAMKHLDADGIAKLEAQYNVKLTRDSKKQKPKEPDRSSAQ